MSTPQIATDKPNPNLKPTGFQSDPHSPFFMSTTDFLSVQAYCEAGINLPISADEAVIKLEIAPEDAKNFGDMITAYGAVHDHCLDFKTNIFPETVGLAADISDYGRAKVPSFYTPLYKIVDGLNDGTIPDDKGQRQLNAILANLSRDAKQRAGNATAVKNRIKDFVIQTQADQHMLEPIEDHYKQEYEGEHGLIEQYKTEIQGELDLIDHYNAEYQEDVRIACTTATYAWIIPEGTIAAAVVAGIYGDRAQKALDNVHEQYDHLQKSRADLASALRLSQSLSLAGDSLKGILDALHSALTVLERIEGVWTALADDIAAVLKTIQNDIKDAPTIIAALGVDEAIKQWKTIADEADNYRANAFIVMDTVENIKKDDPEKYRVPKAS